jgi:hypothetical protein
MKFKSESFVEAIEPVGWLLAAFESLFMIAA